MSVFRPRWFRHYLPPARPLPSWPGFRLFADDFAGTGALAGVWSAWAGTAPTRDTDRAAPVGVGAANRAIVSGFTFGDRQSAEVTLSTMPSADGSVIYLIVRGSTNGANGYFAAINANGWGLWKSLTFNPTQLAAATGTFASGDVVRLSIDGTALSLRKNGVVVASLDAGSDIASGYPGFGFWSQANLNARVESFSADDGPVPNVGVAAVTEAADTVAAATTTESHGTASVTEAGDTVAAIGAQETYGTGAATEADDTASATGQVEIHGSGGGTEEADTLAGSGLAGVTGTAAMTEAADTAASTTATETHGAADVTEAGDTSYGVGGSGTLVSGTMQEAGDTLAAEGSAMTAGDLDAAEAADTVSGSTTTETHGATNATETGDTLAGTASSGGAGFADVTEAPDTSASTSTTEQHAVGTPTESADTAAATGTTGAFGVTGQGNPTEAGDTLAGTTTAETHGTAAPAEAADTGAGVASQSQHGALSQGETPDSTQGIATQTTHGTASATETSDTVFAHDGLHNLGTLSSTEDDDTTAADASQMLPTLARPGRSGSIAEDIQSLTPGAIWEGFVIDAHALGAGIWRFSNWANELGGGVIWQGHVYTPWALKAEGYDRSSNGALPRPQITAANIAGILSALCIDYEDLRMALVTRHRTFVRYLDAANFAAGNAEANPERYMPPEIYRVRRKMSETRQQVAWELTSVFDAAGISLPRRLILADSCTWRRYRGPECGYHGTAMWTADGVPTANPAKDVCGRGLTDCQLRFPNQALRTSAFPGAQVQQ